MPKKIVIIGLGAAGFAAALSARKTDRNVEITVIDSKGYGLMHPCGLPFAISGEVKLDDLKHDIGAEAMRLELIRDSAAKKVDPGEKSVVYQSDGIEKTVNYDKLIICAGSSPLIPGMFKGKDNFFCLHTPEDAAKIAAASKNCRKAFVIGAGAIGLETAISLNKEGIEVEVVEMLGQILPKALDEDIAMVVESHLNSIGIKFSKGAGIDDIPDDSFAVIAAGTRPNTGIAKHAGIRIGDFGIATDKLMRTSVEDIFACGDCVETTNMITGKPWPSLIASAAYQQGTVAGRNAAIEKPDMVYDGSVTAFATVLGGLEVASVGLNSSFAEKERIEFIAGKAASRSRPSWFAGGESIIVKILAEKGSGRIIGGQAVGKSAADKINVISAAIRAGMDTKRFSQIEFSYCPAISQAYDVLTMASDNAIRKLSR